MTSKTRRMSGKVCVITGANTGIGRVVARELARQGARVVLACRSRERSEAALAEVRDTGRGDNADFLDLDLSDLASVRRAATELLDRNHPIHVLINNAGVAGRHGLSADGFELTFGMQLVIVLTALRTLFRDRERFEVRLTRFHPDRCGGLHPISRFLLRLNVALAVLGLMVALMLTAYVQRHGLIAAFWQVGPPLALISYALLAPFLFFYPLIPAHAAMSKEKEAVLTRIAQTLQATTLRLESRLDGTDDIKSEIERIEALEKLHARAQAMPVWPFDVRTLTKFAATIIAPLAIPVGPTLLLRALGT